MRTVTPVARREYRPGGDWTLLALEDLTVLVPAGQSSDFIGSLWACLGDENADLYAVLDVFAATFGLARMPSFAIAEHGSRLRLLVRGAVQATVTTPSGDDAFSGADVGTWLERAFEPWHAVAVSGAPAGVVDEDRTAAGLPLVGGVVGAQSVVVGAVSEPGTAAPTRESAAAPAVGRAVADDAAGPAHAAASPGAEPPAAAPPAAAPPVGSSAASEETLLPVSDATLTAGQVEDTALPGVAEPDAEPEPDPEAAATGLPAREAAVSSEAATSSDAATPDEATTSVSDYDHLWGTTVLRSVEDAAVRSEDADADDGPNDPRANEPRANDPEDNDSKASTLKAGTPEATATTSVSGGPDEESVAPAVPVEPGRAPSDATAGPAATAWTPPGLLIDAVPWGKPAQAQTPRTSAPPRPRAQSEMHYPGGGEDRAGRHNDSGPSITSELYGDHDGETVMRSELDSSALGTASGEDPGPRSAAEAGHGAKPATGPLVLGRRCPQGHASPPSYPQCAVCGEHLGGDPVQVPRPALGRVLFSTGEVIDLVQPLVVGRQPSVSRVASGGMPRLVSVASPSGDISRNHLEVRLEGWHVMVRDLKATNGTVLERPGQAPRRLAQGEMTIVLDGDVADLGDGVSLRFEAVP